MTNLHASFFSPIIDQNLEKFCVYFIEIIRAQFDFKKISDSVPDFVNQADPISWNWALKLKLTNFNLSWSLNILFTAINCVGKNYFPKHSNLVQSLGVACWNWFLSAIIRLVLTVFVFG